jgi:hypothetical protein
MRNGTNAQPRAFEGIMQMTATARVAAFLLATLILLVPAVWNGFPLLFYDTGAYLGRYFFDVLSPGRSAVYGLFLGAARWPDFWPAVLIQSAAAVWIVSLFLRAYDLGNRPGVLVGLIAFFTAATSLPWLTGQLMPDFLAGLAAVAVYLLVFRAQEMSRWEIGGLILLIATAASTHNATMTVLLAMLAAGIAARFIWPYLIPAVGLARTLGAIVLGVVMLFTANFAVTGKLMWTPGGTAFVFSRLVHDGIVHRFLEDNCPNPRYELCKYRVQLPHHANDFLWHQGAEGPFASIGGFDGGAEEMREIAIATLWQYPGLHVWTAMKSTLLQLVEVGTGWGIVYDVWDAYGHIENLVPKAVPAAHSALQRHNKLDFETINLLHEPIALISLALLAAMFLLAWRRPNFAGHDFGQYRTLAATFSVAILANAFVCGVLSNAHDRYGARIAWIAILFVAVAVLRTVPALRTKPVEVAAPATAAAPVAAEPALSYVRIKPDKPQRS